MLEHLEPRVEGNIDKDSYITGSIIIEKDARIKNSHLRGPAIIGQNTVIENSYIGPFTSIHNNCHVRNSEIEYSIVLNDCQILDIGVRIESSLLGTDVELIKVASKPASHRFIIGDQSRVELV